MRRSIEAISTVSLAKPAELINYEHRQCEAPINVGLQHALEAGRARQMEGQK